jgi:RNA polymerase sigma-70 factor (ECF subfamily)
MTRPLAEPELLRHWDAARTECLRLARRYAADDAEDVVQEALLRAWRHRHKCRTPSAPLPWLLTITRNEALRRRRRRMDPLDEVAEPADPSAAEEIARAGVRVDVARALRRLSKAERRLVVLRYLLDWSNADVAEHLGIPEVTVRVRLHRARRRLRAVMAT